MNAYAINLSGKNKKEISLLLNIVIDELYKAINGC